MKNVVNRAIVARKKSLFILAALITATFVNAQITLEQTFPNQAVWPADAFNGDVMTLKQCNQYGRYGENGINGASKLPCPFYYTVTLLVKNSNSNEDLYELQFLNRSDYSTYKTIRLTECELSNARAISYNVFATNKIALITADDYGWKVKDEDGNILYSFDWNEHGYIFIEKYGSEWKLIEVYDDDDTHYTKIYSLPGSGDTQAVSTPSSSKHSARKIVREGQVLVETGNNTYTLHGQELK